MEKYITIREQIKAKNIEASNLFLRKLWSELQMIRENGWFYQPFRKPGENRVYIGRCNFGDVSFDYKNKGCIENMYFENVKAGEEQGIRDAIRKARDIEDINDFYVRIDIPNQGTGICCETDGKTGCVVKKDRTSIYMQMQAYGAKDLEYLLNKKVVVLCNILMLFVDVFCDITSLETTIVPFREYSESLRALDTTEYDYEWVDLDELPTDRDGNRIVPVEAVRLWTDVAASNFNEDKVELLVNACRQFYTAKIMEKRCGGYLCDMGISNAVNSLMVSALEPLAVLEGVQPERCPACGNMKYSVVSNIKNLVEKYSNETFANFICKVFYGQWSKFFHEGRLLTAERKIDVCWPQINIKEQTGMYQVQNTVNTNLSDWVGWLVRKVICEYYKGTGYRYPDRPCRTGSSNAPTVILHRLWSG